VSPTTERHFSVLGSVEVRVDGRRIDLGGAKPRALLAALLANRGRPVSVHTLTETIWGDHPPATAQKSIQKFVSALRRILDDALLTREPGYLIQVADDEVDAAVLETALSRARAGAAGWEEAVESALAAWRGDPYPELADTQWGVAEASRLAELRLEGLELLFEARLDRGEHAAAVAELEELVSRHPFRERFWAQLMLALYRSDRQSDALDAYRRLRTLLGKELGIEPSPELSRLEERILLHDPGLAPVQDPDSPHHLPSSLTSFVGRGSEMAEIRDLVATSRLVTLLGTAGSGKTRLAIEVGRSLLGEFADDGVWFVDLAPVRSPDQVADAIAKPLGIGHLADRPTEEVLADYLAGRRLLLILDNCEHLVNKAASTADRLLHSTSRLVILATSRERLGVEGEVIVDLAPLPYPSASQTATEDFDAVRLFMERARAVSGADELSSSPSVVGEIVRRLDGIPLALELAATRVRSLGLIALRDRLDDRFSVLVSPSRTGLDRHLTLRAAVDWSYQLLDEPEHVLFPRLSVFRGGFTVEAAAAVCGFAPLDENTIPDLVGELVDRSLVTVAGITDTGRRYRLLETLTEFGQLVLDSTEVGTVRDRHADYFRRVAESAADRLRGLEQQKWLAALRADHDNLRKALSWAATTSPETAVRMAVALSRFWDSVGPRSEGHEWMRRAVELSEHLDPRLRIAALIEASDLFSSKHASLPLHYAEQALDVARELGDPPSEAKALRALSWALALDEKPERARLVGLEALALFEDQDDSWERALCLERLGDIGYQDPVWSVDMLTRALQIYREIGDRTREALALYKSADRLAGGLGNTDKALTYAEEAVAILDELGSVHDGAHAKLEYGKILRRVEKYERAEEVLGEALAQLTKSGDERCSVRALTALGTTLVDAGDKAAAEEALLESLRRGRHLDEMHTLRIALAGLARLAADSNRLEEAVMLLGFVKEMGRRLDVQPSETSQEKRETYLEGLRDRVGPEFEGLWVRGGELGLDEAIGLALASPAGRLP